MTAILWLASHWRIALEAIALAVLLLYILFLRSCVITSLEQDKDAYKHQVKTMEQSIKDAKTAADQAAQKAKDKVSAVLKRKPPKSAQTADQVNQWVLEFLK